jgi:hypothetical protein
MPLVIGHPPMPEGSLVIHISFGWFELLVVIVGTWEFLVEVE